MIDEKNMPEERESIFARFKGTDKWQDVMFEKTSRKVEVTVEDEGGVERSQQPIQLTENGRLIAT